MAAIDIKKLDATLRDHTDNGRWHWVVDHESIIGDKDHPPDFTPSGHWEYSPSLREVFAAHADVRYVVIEEKNNVEVSDKGYRIPTLLTK